MKTLTVTDLRAGALHALEHPETYDQRRWCGTTCCVLGHARALAGSDQPNEGPRPGEIERTVVGRAMASLLSSAHAGVAHLIAHGTWDAETGSVTAAAGCPGIGKGAVIGQYAEIGAGARIGADAVICSYAVIGAGATIGAQHWIGAGARIGVGAVV